MKATLGLLLVFLSVIANAEDHEVTVWNSYQPKEGHHSNIRIESTEKIERIWVKRPIWAGKPYRESEKWFLRQGPILPKRIEVFWMIEGKVESKEVEVAFAFN